MDWSTDRRIPVSCEDPDGLEDRQKYTSVMWRSGWIGAQKGHLCHVEIRMV